MGLQLALACGKHVLRPSQPVPDSAGHTVKGLRQLAAASGLRIEIAGAEAFDRIGDFRDRIASARRHVARHLPWIVRAVYTHVVGRCRPK
ncbi:MAG: hypothetical protein ACYS6Z_00960 [Planctomycetota bacterium]